MDERSKSTLDLANLAIALEKAVNMDFMAREHGANVWKAFLKSSGLDVAKKTPPIETKTEITK